MELSFVILTWNSEGYIHQCLQSLIEQITQTGRHAEMFVVDNGSRDNTVALLKDFHASYPDLIVPIYLEQNTGTTYSRNLALQQAKGSYICIMDSDVEVFDGTLEGLIQTVEATPKTGLAVPKLLYPSGHLQKSTDVFPTVFTKFRRYFFLKQIEQQEHDRQQTNSPRTVDYAISAMWMLKREVVDKIGLLDEKIFYAPEDVDYCLRIWKAGFTIVYNPEICCTHHTQEISRGFKLNKAFFSHLKGLAYYFWKHRYVFRKPVIQA